MPKWNLPEIKRHEEKHEQAASTKEFEFPDVYDRQIRIPANSAIIKALTVGEDGTVTLRGKISELVNSESSRGSGRSMLTIELDSVEAYGSEDPEKQMADGFKRGPKSIMRKRY